MNASQAQPEPQLQIVTFLLGTVELGLDVLAVHEVLRARSVLPVPGAPRFVEGIIRVRSTLLPVIDLRRRFGMPMDDTSGDARILAVQLGGERVGLVVDAVRAVVAVPESAVAEPPDRIRGLASEYVRGIAQIDDHSIILVNLDRVLSSDEQLALHEADLDPEADPAPPAPVK